MSSSIDMKIKHYGMLINGEIVSSSDEGYFESVNPSTGEVFATVTNATVDDMRKAIQAARDSVKKGTWKKFQLAERGIYLKKIAKLVRDNARELAEIETRDVGKTSKQSTFIDVPTCAETFEYFSNIDRELATRDNTVDAPVKSTTVFEPYGVVGCIIPYNYPLIMAAWKLAPALMAGNSVVLKLSPLGSVSVLRFAQLINESGIPPGVINILSSDKTETAEELVKNPHVPLVSFTGSTETGREVMRQAASVPKKVILELGGKSANIVFSDCDREAALGGTLSAIFMNQGQMCTACSRLLVEKSMYEEFVGQLVEKTKSLKIGPAQNPDTDFGPLISNLARSKTLDAVKEAVESGAKLLCGGKIPEDGALAKGYFVEPAILGRIDKSMAILKNEIFGPVLTVQKFEDIDEAVRMANDSEYGLAASVWTTDESKQRIVSENLECGTVWINTYGGFYDAASFGGYKLSGFGRELGIEGLKEYTQSKNVCVDQTPGGKPLVSSWF